MDWRGAERRFLSRGLAAALLCAPQGAGMFAALPRPLAPRAQGPAPTRSDGEFRT